MTGQTAWMKHLTQVYKENKAKNADYKFSTAMKDAKKSYRGGSAAKEATVGGGNSILDNAAPVSGGAASIADTAAPVSGGMSKEGAAASEMAGGKRRRRRSGKRKSSKRRSGKRKSSKRKSSKRRR